MSEHINQELPSVQISADGIKRLNALIKELREKTSASTESFTVEEMSDYQNAETAAIGLEVYLHAREDNCTVPILELTAFCGACTRIGIMQDLTFLDTLDSCETMCK